MLIICSSTLFLIYFLFTYNENFRVERLKTDLFLQTSTPTIFALLVPYIYLYTSKKHLAYGLVC